MRILIDIGHPGHVHLFRPFAIEMQRKGHDILFTCRKKEFEIELLKAAGFSFKILGRHYKSTIGKLWGLIKFDAKIFFTALKFKPDLFLSHGSFYAAHASFMLRKPHIALEDTGNMEQLRLYRPFSEVILTSDVFGKDLGSTQLLYSGYHELAYLHPDIYAPDNSIRKVLNIQGSQKAILIRFVSWNASHDVGQAGFSADQKINIVKHLSKLYKVFISSEAQLPEELEIYKLKTEPEQIHDVMAAMSLFVGEGATMASECAMLGTPAIYVNTMEAGSIDDQVGYGLVFHYKNSDLVLDKALELLERDDVNSHWLELRNKMLSNKINVTAFMLWFIENYPKSKQIMMDNPDYQNNFI